MNATVVDQAQIFRRSDRYNHKDKPHELLCEAETSARASGAPRTVALRLGWASTAVTGVLCCEITSPIDVLNGDHVVLPQY